MGDVKIQGKRGRPDTQGKRGRPDMTESCPVPSAGYGQSGWFRISSNE